MWIVWRVKSACNYIVWCVRRVQDYVVASIHLIFAWPLVSCIEYNYIPIHWLSCTTHWLCLNCSPGTVKWTRHGDDEIEESTKASTETTRYCMVAIIEGIVEYWPHPLYCQMSLREKCLIWVETMKNYTKHWAWVKTSFVDRLSVYTISWVPPTVNLKLCRNLRHNVVQHQIRSNTRRAPTMPMIHHNRCNITPWLPIMLRRIKPRITRALKIIIIRCKCSNWCRR